MTDTERIVKGLREYSEWSGRPPTLEMAADELERLTAECAALREDAERMITLLRTPEPERTKLAYQHLRERMEKEPMLGFDLMVKAEIINQAGELRERFGGDAE